MLDLSKTALQELRKRTLADLRAHQNAITDLESVLSDLEAAERLLSRVGRSDPDRPLIQLDEFTALPFTKGNPFRQGSIRAVIWEVLGSSSEVWLTTEAVREEVSKVMGRDLAISSIASSLSRMKPRIRRMGFKVARLQRTLDLPDNQ